jgi:short-subunit dehydrogenase
MYGASKAFLVSFSQSLAAENHGAGVNVSAVCPGFTYSEFHDVNGTRGLVSELPRHMIMQPEPVVEGAIDAVEKGRAIYVPGAWNKFVAGLTRTLPRSVAQDMVARQSRRFRKQHGEG